MKRLLMQLCNVLNFVGKRCCLRKLFSCKVRLLNRQQTLCVFILILLTGSYTTMAYAYGVKTLGDMALTITYSFYGLSKLITAGAYMAGMGFVMASMLKFKAHKDNPTQIPIGTPIALLFVGSALIFLPHIFSIAGETVFGDTSGAAGIYGTTGLAIN
jgi:intracellular multiplication protein IcmD